MTKQQESEHPATPLDALMDAAVDAIIVIDERGTVRRFNAAAQQMFGYEARDIVGGNVSRLMPDPHRDRHDRYLKRYLKTGRSTVIGKGREEFGQRKDGERFPMFLSVGEIREGRGRRFVGIIKDLSEIRAAESQIRQLEEQLLHADRLVILGELTAGIAHEINQPLTAIAAYADAGRHLIDRSDGASPEQLQSICQRIGEQSRRAAEVVQRLRRLVRSGSVSKGRHNINKIIRNTIYLFEYETKKSVTDIQFEPMESLQELYVDDIQVQQILVNLIKNALDAINAAGRSDGRITVSVAKAGTEVRIAVEDNGPGVPAELRDRLFEPFFTTKPKGVGLGLSICRNIAAAHGGSLRFHPTGQGGSRFTLALPLEFIG